MEQGERRKILAGAKMRKLRTELGLSQAAMAQELGISFSYLNLVERNQRPITAQLLIKLSEAYAVDPRSFAQEDGQRSGAEIEEIFADPMFSNTPVPKAEIRELVETAPAALAAIKTLYDAYRARVESGAVRMEQAPTSPVDVIREYLQTSANYFHALEERAEQIVSELTNETDLYTSLTRRLQDKHNIRVQIVPAHVLPQMLRRFDMHRRKVMISELLETPGRIFQVAVHVALLEAEDLIEGLAMDAAQQLPAHSGPATRKFARITLANYFAAALMMPYERFLVAAEQLAYDVEVLASRFSASFEQVAHRLTTLARPSARGVPFFMIRVDTAGNVSKRFSSGAFPFSKFGGTCPRWNLHHSFASPGRIQTQVIELNDGSKWFSLARTVQRIKTPWGEPENNFVVGLGCDIKYAPKLVYAKGPELAAATPIGVNCRMCERANCSQRAAPAVSRPLEVNENVRGFSPFDAILAR